MLTPHGQKLGVGGHLDTSGLMQLLGVRGCSPAGFMGMPPTPVKIRGRAQNVWVRFFVRHLGLDHWYTFWRGAYATINCKIGLNNLKTLSDARATHMHYR